MAMGTKMAPIYASIAPAYANLFIMYLEKELLELYIRRKNQNFGYDLLMILLYGAMENWI